MLANSEAPLIPDEQLDHWGAFFVNNNLHRDGVNFETFMQAPREIARAMLKRRAAADHCPRCGSRWHSDCTDPDHGGVVQ